MCIRSSSSISPCRFKSRRVRYTVLRSTLGSNLCALRKIWLASRCLLAVSITLRIARRCWVMRIPRSENCACSRPGASVCGSGIGLDHSRRNSSQSKCDEFSRRSWTKPLAFRQTILVAVVATQLQLDDNANTSHSLYLLHRHSSNMNRTHRHLIHLCLLSLAPILLAPLALAQESPYFVTYDHYLEEPGNLEVEYFSTFGTQRGA